MYTYKDSYVRPMGRQQHWERKDISDVPVNELLQVYSDVYVFLTHPNYDGVHHLNIKEIPKRLNPETVTTSLSQWLEDLGNEGLPLVEGRKHFDLITAPYTDAWKLDCNIQPIHPSYHKDQDLPLSEKRDLLLSHPGIDPEILYNECLFTVNGLFHYAGQTSDGIQITEGMVNCRTFNDNHVGLFRLGMLGKMTTRRVRPENIISQSNLRDKVLIELSDDLDIDNKSIFLVVGGSFQHTHYYFKRVGERLFEFNMRDYPFVDHFFKLKRHIDTTCLRSSHDKSTTNEDIVAIDELYSDKTICEFLTLPHTFFVVVDHPDIIIERSPVEDTQLPGVGKSHLFPYWPVVGRLGLFKETWFLKGEPLEKFYFNRELKPRYSHESTHWRENSVVDNARLPHDRYDRDANYVLRISGYR